MANKHDLTSRLDPGFNPRLNPEVMRRDSRIVRTSTLDDSKRVPELKPALTEEEMLNLRIGFFQDGLKRTKEIEDYDPRKHHKQEYEGQVIIYNSREAVVTFATGRNLQVFYENGESEKIRRREFL